MDVQNKNINTINELPNGNLLTGRGGKVVLNESDRRFVAVMQPDSSNVDAAGCWVLSTIEGKKGTATLQIMKKLREQKIVVDVYAIVPEGVLKALYETDDRHREELFASGSLQDSHVIKSIMEMMSLVVAEKASDVHIEKRHDQACVKIRKNGEIMKLKGYETISQTHATEMCTVIYNVLAEADSKDVSFNETLIQQGAGKLSVPVGQHIHEIKLRFQSIPVYPDGFDVIMRVLPVGKNEKYTTLEELGYEQSQIKLILECVSRAVGAVIIAGVTGSGKSTTLKNLLMWLNEEREYSEKIFTVEDPPEYIIPHVSQHPVIRGKDDVEKKRTPFEDAIKACMRGDPDLIMIGEIRDGSTGDLLKKAVQSGHRVLSTTHAPSPLGVVDRLMDFGLSVSTLSSQEFLAGVMYQRLLAELCKSCSTLLVDALASSKVSKHLIELNGRIERTLKDGNTEDYGSYLNKVRLRGKGCSECSNGVTGRTVCAEVMKPDLTILTCIQHQDLLGALGHLRNKVSDQSLVSKNMVGKSAMAHAFYKMVCGRIDPVELERSFGVISVSEIRGLPEVKASDYKEDEFSF